MGIRPPSGGSKQMKPVPIDRANIAQLDNARSAPYLVICTTDAAWALALATFIGLGSYVQDVRRTGPRG